MSFFLEVRHLSALSLYLQNLTHYLAQSLVTVTIQVINSVAFKEYVLENMSLRSTFFLSFSCDFSTTLRGLQPLMFLRSLGAHGLFHYNLREE